MEMPVEVLGDIKLIERIVNTLSDKHTDALIADWSQIVTLYGLNAIQQGYCVQTIISLIFINVARFLHSTGFLPETGEKIPVQELMKRLTANMYAIYDDLKLHTPAVH